eukprot:g3092.t1
MLGPQMTATSAIINTLDDLRPQLVSQTGRSRRRRHRTGNTGLTVASAGRRAFLPPEWGIFEILAPARSFDFSMQRLFHCLPVLLLGPSTLTFYPG